jgi:hypothetical protein
MNRERALTIAGGFVAVVMVGLLSITAINGRWLGYPKRLYREEVGKAELQRELRSLVLDQVAYHARQRTYTSDLEELGFESWDPRIAVAIQAADKDGWTAVATSEDVRMVCVMRVGQGPAANTAVDSLLAARGVESEQVETCEVADSTATPVMILKVAENRL